MLKIKKQFYGITVSDNRGTFDSIAINNLPVELRQMTLQNKLKAGFADLIEDCDCDEQYAPLKADDDCGCSGKKKKEIIRNEEGGSIEKNKEVAQAQEYLEALNASYNGILSNKKVNTKKNLTPLAKVEKDTKDYIKKTKNKK